jgi:hypothetical protein
VHAGAAFTAVAIDDAGDARAELAITDFAVFAGSRVATGFERDAFARVTAFAVTAVTVFTATDAKLLHGVAHRVAVVLLAVGGAAAGVLLEALIVVAAVIGGAIPVVLTRDATLDLVAHGLFGAVAVGVGVADQVAWRDG